MSRKKIDWPAVIVVGGIHLLALTAFLPWLFSWAGVALALVGLYTFGTLGINMGFHRLLSHRSFKCRLWVERILVLLGVCCLEKTPGQFVTTHRAHHQFSDKEGDPHSPSETLFWGHMGWIFVENPNLTTAAAYERYAKDVFKDPFYLKLERNFLWLWIYFIHALLFYFAGFCIGFAVHGAMMAGIQLGLSFLVWGVFVRTVAVWHITWSVNSIGHVWGYRNYDTSGSSRNSLIIGLISNGDGWHNNHHADQRAAAHGHKWWEFDLTFLTLQVMVLLGLAWELVPIRDRKKESSLTKSTS